MVDLFIIFCYYYTMDTVMKPTERLIDIAQSLRVDADAVEHCASELNKFVAVHFPVEATANEQWRAVADEFRVVVAKQRAQADALIDASKEVAATSVAYAALQAQLAAAPVADVVWDGFVGDRQTAHIEAPNPSELERLIGKRVFLMLNEDKG